MASRPVTKQPKGSGPPGGDPDGDLELVDLNDQDLQYQTYAQELDILEQEDFLRITEHVMYDIRAECGAGNTYHIKNSSGEKIMYAVEDGNCFCRWMCGPHRLFHMTIYNMQDEPLLHLDNSCCRCDWCCCFDCCCCTHKIYVRDAMGNIIGIVKEKFHIFHCKIDVMTKKEKVFAKIKGPCCACRCCTEMNFDILNKTGNRHVGYIYKRHIGYKANVNMDHDNYEIHFPSGSTITEKATLLGSAFLVNMMYFEMS